LATELTFAFVRQNAADPIGLRLAELVEWIARRSKRSIKPACARSYEELARLCHEGKVHAAWLPPIVFLHLERQKLVVPLLSNERGNSVGFHSVLIVRADSKIRTVEQVKGTRAAWVDPWSAAGYVLPRIELAEHGIEPRSDFSFQRFKGSHEAAIRSVLDGQFDVTATFAHTGPSGGILRGGWSDMDKSADAFRVVTTFSEIPADVIAASTTLPAEEQQALVCAFQDAFADERIGEHVRAVFGVESFYPGVRANYEAFRVAVKAAFRKGLIDGLENGGTSATD
jgi:phosphate/phosphite/phosphonate ABC transporter binding protein